MSRHNNRLHTFKVRFRENGFNKAALINVRSHEQAERVATRFNGVYSIMKVDHDKVVRSDIGLNGIKRDVITEIPMYENAIHMDEMIWMKRNVRMNNKAKDNGD